MSWPRSARQWTHDDVVADVARAAQDFRARRLGEPLERYLGAFDAAKPQHEALVASLNAVLAGDDAALLRTLWATEAGKTGFRYLGAPPISMDDLETLAETRLSPSAADDPHGAGQRLVDVLRMILDPRRFPGFLKAERRCPASAKRRSSPPPHS